MMRLLPFWLLLLLFAAVPSCAENEFTTVSPRRSFRIVQTFGEQGWTQVLRFAAAPARNVTLESAIPWPADYHVSPDERWVLRIQKSGSGDNISFLYRLEPAVKRVWRLEEQVGALGFDYLAGVSGLLRSLYHTGIEFRAWDLRRGLLRFTIHASDADNSGGGFDRPLVYRLRDHTVTAP